MDVVVVVAVVAGGKHDAEHPAGRLRDLVQEFQPCPGAAPVALHPYHRAVLELEGADVDRPAEGMLRQPAAAARPVSAGIGAHMVDARDRKSTRLNSSH